MKFEELLKDNPDALKALQDAIEKANDGQEDKLKHVRFADLSEGAYVSKGKYDSLNAENQTNTSKLAEANQLIESLQKSAKGDEKLQKQVTDYQSRVQELEAELAATKINAAIKVGLLAENATDVDYLTYKLKEKGENLELDEQGKIKGWADKIAALKTQLPGQFASQTKAQYEGFRPIEKDAEQQTKGISRTELLKMPYMERQKFYQEHTDEYKEIMKN